MKLNDFLKEYKLTTNAFAVSIGVAPQQIQRIVEGKDLYLGTAEKIVRGTFGKVTYEDLLTDSPRCDQLKKHKGKKSNEAHNSHQNGDTNEGC